MAKKKAVRKRRKKTVADSRGLATLELQSGLPSAEVVRLGEQVDRDGGSVLGRYRDPLGGKWQMLVALPLKKVKPTPFQRNLSDAHVKRLSDKIDRLDRFLDPIILVKSNTGDYETPNGYHRIASLQRLGAKAVTGILVPESELAFQILALNTEKAHNVREKSLEAIRMARELARLAPTESEGTYAAEFEEPSFLTLGICYDRQGMFSGGVYHPVLRRTEEFFDDKLPRALARREKRADQLFELDAMVVDVVERLKTKGLKSPFLKAFVVARINPLRFKRDVEADFDETYVKMRQLITKFDAAKVQQHHLASMAGAAPDAE